MSAARVAPRNQLATASAVAAGATALSASPRLSRSHPAASARLRGSAGRVASSARAALLLLFVACAAAPLRGADAPARRRLNDCSVAKLAFYAATADGACFSCTSRAAGEPACGVACPQCVAATETYLAACASDGFTSLNYGDFMVRVELLDSDNDCHTWLAHRAETSLLPVYCSKAFHHVVATLESARADSAVVNSGAFDTPPPCLLADDAACPDNCQSDLDLLRKACHASDVVDWAGHGMWPDPAQAALHGTNVSVADAWLMFVNGTGSVPINLGEGITDHTPLPLDLSACDGCGADFPYCNFWAVTPVAPPSPPPSPPPPPPPPPPLPPPAPPADGRLPPHIRIAALGARKASPDAKLVLNASVVSMDPSALRLSWELTSAPAGASALAAAALTPLTQPLLVMPPSALVAGGSYTFHLTASDGIGTTVASATVEVAARPWGAAGGAPSLAASPASGAAFSDVFTLTTLGWVAIDEAEGVDHQLEYSFTCTSGNGDTMLLADFSAAPSVSFLLPGGNYTFAVAARNAFGALSAGSVTAAATAAPPALAGDPSALLSAAGGAASAALAAGNAAGAAALTGALADLLNDPAATAGMSDAALRAARDALLSTLALVAGAISSPGELAAAAAATASVVAAGASGLSPAGLSAAVGVLGALAAAPGGSMPPAAASSLAGAVGSIGAPNASATLLANLGPVVGNLSASMAGEVSLPGETFAVSAPGVAIAAAVDDPLAPGSRLFAAPIGAPGVAFAPLPAGALGAAPAGVAVRSSFSALAFDPFTGGDTGTGVVTLSFASAADGAPIPVRDVATPITFSMPALRLSGDGFKAACAYWDEAARAYSTDGCAAMPNPAPPPQWLTLSWRANLTLRSAAQLATAWQPAGPLLADCAEVVIDCSDAAQRALTVVHDPTDLFSTPPAGCGNATAGVLRVFTGTGCALYSARNAAGCSWSTPLQAFTGDGCVAANETRCACTHLTSFTGQPAPKVAVCSAQQLVNFSPRDLITRLRMLFGVVIGLFGAMHIGAAIGVVQDRYEKAAYMRRLMTPGVGFHQAPCGAWTWHFEQRPLESEMGAVPGNMVDVARVIGIPFSRLRCALPEEMCPGITAQMVGRRHGLSASGVEAHAQSRLALLRRMFGQKLTPEENALTLGAKAAGNDDTVPKHGAADEEQGLADKLAELAAREHEPEARAADKMLALASCDDDQMEAAAIKLRESPVKAKQPAKRTPGPTKTLTQRRLAMPDGARAKAAIPAGRPPRPPSSPQNATTAQTARPRTAPAAKPSLAAAAGVPVRRASTPAAEPVPPPTEQAPAEESPEAALERAPAEAGLPEEAPLPPAPAPMLGLGEASEAVVFADAVEELPQPLEPESESEDAAEDAAPALPAAPPVAAAPASRYADLLGMYAATQAEDERERLAAAPAPAPAPPAPPVPAAAPPAPPAADAAPKAVDDDAWAQGRKHVMSTAFMLAVMSMRCLRPEFELAQRSAASAAYLRAQGLDPHERFYELLGKFRCLLASDNLRRSGQWFDRARLWRIILLADDDGSWAPTHGLAFSLQAVRAKPRAVSRAKTLIARLLSAIGVLVAMVTATFCGLSNRGDGTVDAEGDDDGERRHGSALDRLDSMQAPTPDEEPDEEEDADAAAGAAKEDEHMDDCPLTYSLQAILVSMPRALKQSGLSPDAARRYWATALTAAVMRGLEMQWLLHGPGYLGSSPVGDGVSHVTLLDRADAWLAAQALPEAAASAVRRAAKRKAHEWREMQDQRITAMRAAELTTRAHAVSVLQRTAGSLVRAFFTSHQTLSIFITPYLDSLRRWQAFMTLVSGILAVLVVNIWMLYSHGLECCSVARQLLGCGGADTGPCLGFTGDCADLPAVFAGVAVSGAPGIPVGYVCQQFPVPGSDRDAFILGLISWACALPVTILITNCFFCANSPDYDPAWLYWDFKRRVLLGAMDWAYQGETPPSLLKRRLATAWLVNPWYNLQQALAARPTEWLLRRALRRRQRRGEPPLPEGGVLAAALATQLKMDMFAVSGIASVYLVWAIMSWLIFAYGELAYRLLGETTEERFTKGWGVGLAISQATQFQGMLVVALQSAALLTVLESMWLMGNKPWLEEHIDFASVQASLLADGAGTSWARRMHTHLAFYSAVA